MENKNRIVDIIEDHAIIESVLLQIQLALEHGYEMPNYIPQLNDGMLTDTISKICERITKLRRNIL